MDDGHNPPPQPPPQPEVVTLSRVELDNIVSQAVQRALAEDGDAEDADTDTVDDALLDDDGVSTSDPIAEALARAVRDAKAMGLVQRNVGQL